MTYLNTDLLAYLVLAVLAVVVVGSAIKVVREYERAVVFTLGRFSGIKGPGLIIIIPAVQQFVRIDLRTRVLDVPSQDVISHDNVSVKVNAVIYFRVIDADKAVPAGRGFHGCNQPTGADDTAVCPGQA